MQVLAKGDGQGCVTWGKRGEGEDRTFCDKVKQAGFLVSVNCDVNVGHRFPSVVEWDYEAKAVRKS